MACSGSCPKHADKGSYEKERIFIQASNGTNSAADTVLRSHRSGGQEQGKEVWTRWKSTSFPAPPTKLLIWGVAWNTLSSHCLGELEVYLDWLTTKFASSSCLIFSLDSKALLHCSCFKQVTCAFSALWLFTLSFCIITVLNFIPAKVGTIQAKVSHAQHRDSHSSLQ